MAIGSNLGATRQGTVLGASAVAALCAIIAGANLANPLIPEYNTRYELTPFAQSTVFSAYLIALIGTLPFMVFSRRVRLWNPRTTLLAALGITTVSDVAMMLGSESFEAILVGRVLVGMSVAMSTGAAASLALSSLGEHARTMVATSAVLGSLVGNMAGGFGGTVLPAPTVSVYVLHAIVVVCIMLPLTMVSVDRVALMGRNDTSVRKDHRMPYTRRHRTAGFALGGIAWSIAGVILALVPAELRRGDDSLTLFDAVLPSGVFLAAAWCGQAAVKKWLPGARAWEVLILLVVGLCLSGFALKLQDGALLLVAAAVTGLGQGPAYSIGLATVTYGLAPRAQGISSSVYAGSAYATCAIVTLTAGLVGTVTSVPSAIFCLVAATTVAAVGVVALAGPPQTLVSSPTTKQA